MIPYQVYTTRNVYLDQSRTSHAKLCHRVHANLSVPRNGKCFQSQRMSCQVTNRDVCYGSFAVSYIQISKSETTHLDSFYTLICDVWTVVQIYNLKARTCCGDIHIYDDDDDE